MTEVYFHQPRSIEGESLSCSAPGSWPCWTNIRTDSAAELKVYLGTAKHIGQYAGRHGQGSAPGENRQWARDTLPAC